MNWCHQATSHYLKQYWPRSIYAIQGPHRLDEIKLLSFFSEWSFFVCFVFCFHWILSVHVLSNWVSIPDDICNGVVLHFIKPGVHENSKHFFSECISLGPLLMFTNISKVFCFDLCSDFLQWEYFHQPFFQNYLYCILQFYWSIYSLHMVWNEAWFY